LNLTFKDSHWQDSLIAIPCLFSSFAPVAKASDYPVLDDTLSNPTGKIGKMLAYAAKAYSRSFAFIVFLPV